MEVDMDIITGIIIALGCIILALIGFIIITIME